MRLKLFKHPIFKKSFVILVFIIIVYQAGLFIHKSAVLKIESNYDNPDTVYIVNESDVNKFLSEIPSYLLGCNISDEAALIAESAMNKRKD